MHLNPKFILREVAGETLLISLQDISAPKKIICLNELGKEVYFLLQKGCSKEQIAAELLSQYEVDESVLLSDIDAFLSTLIHHNILIDA